MANGHDDTALYNALHAAEVWLQRMRVEANAIAVVTLAPRAAVGLWRPGQPMVSRLPEIDDAGADLCEAAALLAPQMFERLDPDARVAVIAKLAAGVRLQVLLAPAPEAASLRMDDMRRAVELVSVTLAPDVSH